jgi:hypothetical protein
VRGILTAVQNRRRQAGAGSAPAGGADVATPGKE